MSYTYYWYPSGPLRNRICIITDMYALGYVEIFDTESKQYKIIKFNNLTEKQNEN